MSYWGTVFRRALDDTLDYFGEGLHKLTFTLLCSIAGLVILFMWKGMDAALGQMASAYSVLIATLLVTLLLFFRNLILAPARLAKDVQSQITTLSEKLHIYEDRAAPKLEFVFEEHGWPYECLEKSNPSLKMWLFRIGVRNKWYEQVRDCVVKLETVSPHGERFIIRNLKSWTDNPSDVLNIPHKQSFTLNADDTEYIDVIRVRQYSEKVEIEVCYALEGHRDISAATGLVGGSTYALTLKAIASIGGPSYRTFTLEATPEHVTFKGL